MANPKLFEPIRVGNLELSNRIVIAPMCQYSAEDGCMTDWHLIHLGHLALSGAALLTIEATAVLPEGRISWADVGLWSDANEAALRADAVRGRGQAEVRVHGQRRETDVDAVQVREEVQHHEERDQAPRHLADDVAPEFRVRGDAHQNSYCRRTPTLRGALPPAEVGDSR